jgi:hypothetical protein
MGAVLRYGAAILGIVVLGLGLAAVLRPREKAEARLFAAVGAGDVAAVEGLKALGFVKVAKKKKTKIPRLTSLLFDLTEGGVIVLLSALAPGQHTDLHLTISEQLADTI